MQNIVLFLLLVVMSGLSILRPKKGTIAVLAGALILSGTTIYFIPAWSNISWVVTAASFFLIVPSVFCLGKKNYKRGNYLILAMLMFGLYCLLSTVSNYQYIEESVATIKNIFQFWSIPLLAYVGIIDKSLKDSLIKIVLIVAFLQIPVSIYQYFFIVDWSSRIAGGDSVVGTFGGSIDGGGNSGALTTFLLIVWTFIIAWYLQKKKLDNILLVTSFCLLIPVMLNETKIFFVYLPIIVALLFYFYSKIKPMRTLMTTSLMGLAGFLVLVFYFVFLQHSGIGVKDSKDLESYVERRINNQSGLSVTNSKEIGLTRLGSILYWWEEHSIGKDFNEIIFGHGLGSSKGSGVFVGHLYNENKYKDLKLDVTGLAKYLWDLGLLGTILYISIFISAYITLDRARILNRNTIENAFVISSKISIIILALDNIYDTYLIRSQGLNIIFSCIIAYTLYIYRNAINENRIIKDKR
ncbi:MAG: hypothetical protein JAZ17_22000 [Candidatus Thiodiazotropha endolucinida]|nr:hypothetical protein [Candidatus Thiodiazotropha taylori]MCG8096261.1 hypothetical protein [Candidatus Thiodiazotropha endolucinida]MCW4315065.1 hypothetical protein [Candidatus Thiodiazotropha taylori]